MSDIGVSYNLSYSPNPVTLDVKVGAHGSDVNITLLNVPTLAISATPRISGNVLVSAISVVLTPVANAITLSLGLFAGQIMNGKKFKIFTIDPIDFDIEGVRGKLKPKALRLSQSNGMLVVTGDFDL